MTGRNSNDSGKDKEIARLKSTVLELKKKLREMKAAEEKLLGQETIYKDIFDTVKEGIAYTTLKGKVILINHSLEKILDVPKENIIGKNIITLVSDFLDKGDANNVIRLLKSVMDGKKIKPFQVNFKEKVLEVSVNINFSAKNLTGTIHDVTEKKRIADALSTSESRLRRAELASKSGNWELHFETGKMIGSEGARKIYGINAESLEYSDIRALPLPEYRKMMDETLENLIAGIKPYNIEFKIKKADTGEIIDIHSISEFDRNKNILYGSIQDVTDRKKVEEQLLMKNRDLSVLLRMSLQLLESLEKRKVLKKIVEDAANLVGTDTSAIYLVKGEDLVLEVTSPPLPENFPAEFRIAKLKNHPHIEEAIKSRKTVIITDVQKSSLTEEERLITETRNLGSMVFLPLFIQNKAEGVIILGTLGRKHNFEQHEIDLFSTFSNISSLALDNSDLYESLKVSMERAEESNKLKTAFLHNISHEIRTPLNAIIGFSGILGQYDLSPEEKNEYLSIITQSNNQLLSIIDDILNISHIEAGQVNINETKVDLTTMLKNLHRQYYPEAVKRGLNLIVKNSILNQDVEILTDEQKIIGIITNLLNNAFKFTHEGSVELGCNLISDKVEFYVSDTGIGIPESEHAKIFSRFYQIKNPAARLYGGMGLGLSICAAYAELLGGRFTLSSSPGKGSRFAFTIPYKKAESVIPSAGKERVVTRGKQSRRRLILIAEDEDSSYAFIREVLKPLDHKILRAYNGSDAVDICASNPDIDLVLMDIRMPRKDGYEAAAEIVKIRPHLPIIAQTAYGYPRDRKNALEKGCIDYLAKPFNGEQLISMIEKYLK